MEHKVPNEIHANEIVLLAYYIAANHIEGSLSRAARAATYVPFEGNLADRTPPDV